MKRDIKYYLGNNLRKFREEKHYTQEEFAELCDISRAYYGRIERGENNITIEKCAQISNVLGIHISELFIDLPE